MFRRMTVDGVMASFKRALDRLQAVEERQAALAKRKYARANDLFADAEVAEAEAHRAALIRTRLSGLIE